MRRASGHRNQPPPRRGRGPARRPAYEARPGSPDEPSAELRCEVDEELMQSFPASDPPSWTLGRRPSG